jgi:ubiquinone/menaquinone biosynthesis C-methylase UbiE
MIWYDYFASFYDSALERLYRPFRSQTIARAAPSSGMLARAKARVDQHGWDIASLVQKDARQLDLEDLGSSEGMDGLICTLGFLDASPHIHGGRVFIASGLRKLEGR